MRKKKRAFLPLIFFGVFEKDNVMLLFQARPELNGPSERS